MSKCIKHNLSDCHSHYNPIDISDRDSDIVKKVKDIIRCVVEYNVTDRKPMADVVTDVEELMKTYNIKARIPVLTSDVSTSHKPTVTEVTSHKLPFTAYWRVGFSSCGVVVNDYYDILYLKWDESGSSSSTAGSSLADRLKAVSLSGGAGYRTVWQKTLPHGIDGVSDKYLTATDHMVVRYYNGRPPHHCVGRDSTHTGRYTS